MFSRGWSRLAAVENAFHRSFSSELDASLSLAEGHELAVHVGASPYATGLFTKPPLFLAAYQHTRELWWPGLQSLLLAFLVHQIFRTEKKGEKTKTKGKPNPADCKSARYLAVCVVLLAGHRFSLEECSLLVSLFGAIQGSGVVTLTGTALALYAAPTTTFLLVWALYKVFRNKSSLLRRKGSNQGGGSFFLLFLAKLGLGCLVLVFASTYFLKFVLEVKDYQKMGFTSGTFQWMRCAYFADFALVGRGRDDALGSKPLSVDALAPSASLLWYFQVQMFPEMRKMFLLLSQVQPLLFALPLAQELCTLDARGQAFDMHLLTSQFLICNLFRMRYRLTSLCLELVFVFVLLGTTHQQMQLGDLASTKVGGRRKKSPPPPLPLQQAVPFIGAGFSIISLLLWMTHTLWIYFGTANSNYYWAMTICFALLRLALVHVLIQDHGALKTLLRGDEDKEKRRKGQ
jgi:hypothetical protein